MSERLGINYRTMIPGLRGFEEKPDFMKRISRNFENNLMMRMEGTKFWKNYGTMKQFLTLLEIM
jgi:hypothetical protein